MSGVSAFFPLRNPLFPRLLSDSAQQHPGQQDPRCSLWSRPPRVTSANTHRAFKRVRKGILERDDIFHPRPYPAWEEEGTDFWDIISECGALTGLSLEWKRHFNFFFSKNLFQLRVGLFPVTFYHATFLLSRPHILSHGKQHGGNPEALHGERPDRMISLCMI